MSMIGHNMPPKDDYQSTWRKSYFYMPMGEAQMVVALLQALKKNIDKRHDDMHKIINDRIAFLEKKMGTKIEGQS